MCSIYKGLNSMKMPYKGKKRNESITVLHTSPYKLHFTFTHILYCSLEENRPIVGTGLLSSWQGLISEKKLMNIEDIWNEAKCSGRKWVPRVEGPLESQSLFVVPTVTCDVFLFIYCWRDAQTPSAQRLGMQQCISVLNFLSCRCSFSGILANRYL